MKCKSNSRNAKVIHEMQSKFMKFKSNSWNAIGNSGNSDVIFVV